MKQFNIFLILIAMFCFGCSDKEQQKAVYNEVQVISIDEPSVVDMPDGELSARALDNLEKTNSETFLGSSEQVVEQVGLGRKRTLDVNKVSFKDVQRFSDALNNTGKKSTERKALADSPAPMAQLQSGVPLQWVLDNKNFSRPLSDRDSKAPVLKDTMDRGKKTRGYRFE